MPAHRQNKLIFIYTASNNRYAVGITTVHPVYANRGSVRLPRLPDPQSSERCSFFLPWCRCTLFWNQRHYRTKESALHAGRSHSQIIAWSLQSAPEPTVPGKFNQFELHPGDGLNPPLLWGRAGNAHDTHTQNHITSVHMSQAFHAKIRPYTHTRTCTPDMTCQSKVGLPAHQ